MISKMTVDFTTMGVQTGDYLVDYLKDKKADVVTFPGPSGSGWAEAFLDGFKKAIKDKKTSRTSTTSSATWASRCNSA